jgi:hypothetical protein
MTTNSTQDALLGEFVAPPDCAKPRVWWHWMNGNVTKEGIDKDFQWMKRVGIAGVQHFDGALDTVQVVPERLVYMAPGWKDAFGYALKRAEELGLEFTIASSPGWSETGGPWVAAADGMKKLVWSETRVSAGTTFAGVLPQPPTIAGPFQDIPLVSEGSAGDSKPAEFYRDIAVMAHPVPRRLVANPSPVAVVTSERNERHGVLRDGEIASRLSLRSSAGRPAWVIYEYATPRRFRAATLVKPMRYAPIEFQWSIEASVDGVAYTPVAEFPGDLQLSRATITFPETHARFLRLVITQRPRQTWFKFAANAPGVARVPAFHELPASVEFDELHFYGAARVNRFEEKAGFSIAPGYYALATLPELSDEAVSRTEVVNLTHLMKPDGSLEWSAPDGEVWSIIRFGYSLTGKTNHPATPEATGLEVDKLDRSAVTRYLRGYLRQFEEAVGRERFGKRGIAAILTDSIEARGQNWTEALPTEFRRRRGYALHPFMPALTGVIVSSSDETDRFLWDFRSTLMELMAESHYGQIAEYAHSLGMVHYCESLEGYPTMALGDDLQMRQCADIPMCAIWTNYDLNAQDGIPNHVADMLGAASVAHVLGKPIVAAEALTSGYEPWAFSPATLRPVIDLAFALGVNRCVIHASVHQPTELKPGLTLGDYGQHFTRHETWAEMAGPWVTYLARCSYLLQRGRFVADLAWFYGEEGSLAGLYAEGTPKDLPTAYAFDFVNANMLVEHLYAEGNSLVSSGGARYRALYLGGTSSQMTLKVLRKLHKLALSGVPISGLRPTGSPSYADQADFREYQLLVDALWDRKVIREHKPPDALLRELEVVPDCEFRGAGANARLLFLHRTLAPEGIDIYFVTNRSSKEVNCEGLFRVVGRRATAWRADVGRVEPLAWRRDGARTIVDLHLKERESIFVVFAEPTSKVEGAVRPPTDGQTLLVVGGEWEIRFEPLRGAPEGAFWTKLGSWSDSDDTAIRYFSGVATYRKDLTVNLSEVPLGARVILDLGVVHEIADVRINGKFVGVLWNFPFWADVTDVVRTGSNVLEVGVANLWVNRLIGDKQPEAIPVAFTTATTYAADAPLRISGLIGPVKLAWRYS